MNKPTWGKKDAPADDAASTLPMSLATDDQYANTVPQPLEPAAAKPLSLDLDGLSLAPVAAGEYELMAEIKRDGRVCPLPTRWLEFYRVLQDNAAGAQLPAPPLTGSAWASTPAAAKRMCFREQAEWAVAHNCVAAAFHFLDKLPKTDWYYGD